MPRIIEKTVYQFSELSDKAKDKARDWFRSCSDSSDLDSVVTDFCSIAEIIGLELSTHSVHLMNGKTRDDPNIYFSVGYCQSDYAAFSGTWKYKAGCLKAIKDYASQDKTLHSIVSDWQALQKTSFYQLRVNASCGRSNQHVDSVYRYDDKTVDYSTESEAGNIVDRLASWLYSALREEVDYLSSDEHVDEGITANEYEFYENGERV